MSWLPDKDPVLGDKRVLRRARARHRAARARSRRLRGAPRAAARQAADGRAVHLLRPDGPGAVRRRPGHGRAPASAYRARHRHLSVRRPRHAPRQRRQRAGDHARRHEPDDRRARHRAFRAHPAERRAQRRRHVRHPELDRAAAGRTRRSTPSFQHFDAASLPVIEDGGVARAGHRRLRLRPDTRRSACCPNGSMPRSCSSAGATAPLDADHEERAIYVVDGEIEIAGDSVRGPRLLVFRPGDRITVQGDAAARG